MKGALVGRLVANQDSESGGQFALGHPGERFALQTEGAVFEPVVFGHIGDEEGFGGAGWGVFREEGIDESLVLSGVFAGNERGA